QNGTYFNENRVSRELEMRPGDRIRIGETELLFCKEMSDGGGGGARTSVIFSNEVNNNPEVTLGPEPGALMSRILAPSSTQILSDRQLQKQAAKEFIDHAQKRDLLGLVSKVGLMLSDWSLDQLLENVLDIVFENIQAERGFLLTMEKTNDKPAGE